MKLKLISLFLVLAMMLSSCLVACGDNSNENPTDATDDTLNSTEGSYDETFDPKDEYKLPLEDGYNQLTIYFNHKDTYDKCDIWMWWGDVAGKGYPLYKCGYGAKAVVIVPVGIDKVGFIVRKNCSDPGGSEWGSATKDFDADRYVILEGRETVIYLKGGVEDQFRSNDGGKTLALKNLYLAYIINRYLRRYLIG